jgi:hypothetical protein
MLLLRRSSRVRFALDTTYSLRDGGSSPSHPGLPALDARGASAPALTSGASSPGTDCKGAEWTAGACYTIS